MAYEMDAEDANSTYAHDGSVDWVHGSESVNGMERQVIGDLSTGLLPASGHETQHNSGVNVGTSHTRKQMIDGMDVDENSPNDSTVGSGNEDFGWERASRNGRRCSNLLLEALLAAPAQQPRTILVANDAKKPAGQGMADGTRFDNARRLDPSEWDEIPGVIRQDSGRTLINLNALTFPAHHRIISDTSKSAEARIGNATKEANATQVAAHSKQAASAVTRDNRSRRFAELQAKGTRRTREENYEKQYLKVFEAIECGITPLLPPWEQEIAEYLDNSRQITGVDWCEFERRTFVRLRQFFANLKDQNAADEEPAADVADSATAAEPRGLVNAPKRNEEGRGTSHRGWADMNPPPSTMQRAHCYRKQCRDCGMFRPVEVPGAPSSCWACGGVVVTSTFPLE